MKEDSRDDSNEPKVATSHAKWNDAYRKRWGITNGPAAELPEAVRSDLRWRVQRLRVVENPGFGRIDVRLLSGNELFVIEANPNPSLAPDDDFARAASARKFSTLRCVG